jgi:hypothetical protein
MSCKKCADKEAAVKQAEQERILKALNSFQNPAWRKNYLEAIKKLIEG